MIGFIQGLFGWVVPHSGRRSTVDIGFHQELTLPGLFFQGTLTLSSGRAMRERGGQRRVDSGTSGT